MNEAIIEINTLNIKALLILLFYKAVDFFHHYCNIAVCVYVCVTTNLEMLQKMEKQYYLRCLIYNMHRVKDVSGVQFLFIL